MASILTIVGFPPEARAAVPAAACVLDAEPADRPSASLNSFTDPAEGLFVSVHLRLITFYCIGFSNSHFFLSFPRCEFIPPKMAIDEAR